MHSSRVSVQFSSFSSVSSSVQFGFWLRSLPCSPSCRGLLLLHLQLGTLFQHLSDTHNWQTKQPRQQQGDRGPRGGGGGTDSGEGSGSGSGSGSRAGADEQSNSIHFAPHRDVCAQMFKHCGSRRKKAAAAGAATGTGAPPKAIPKTELNPNRTEPIRTHIETLGYCFCLKFVFEWKTFVKINYEFVRSIVFR